MEPLSRNKKMLCFGYGYTASHLHAALAPFGWSFIGTTTDADKKIALKKSGVEAYIFDRNHAVPDPLRTFRDVTHVLLSVPPDDRGDPVFDVHGEDLAALPNLEWVGYLSMTGIYGNHDGKWVDETTPPAPTSRRGSLRLKAELQWQSLSTLPLHLFRVSGIYGPGRSAIESVRSGNSRRIEKPGHVFNRIHVADIVQTLIASINRPNAGSVYNLADDLPAPSYEVIAYACALAGIEPLPLVPFDQVDMAPMARSFYKDNKRVKNEKIKTELGVQLLYPDYKVGLDACFKEEKGQDTPPLFIRTDTTSTQ